MLNMQSDAYLNLLSSYLLYNRVVAKSEFDFKSQKEYDEYLKLNPPTTVNNEIVKSYGEMDIANFLMQNGIRYIYEQPYEMDTSTSEHSQYHPDFYLPDYKIYIEYFGINRKGLQADYVFIINNKKSRMGFPSKIQDAPILDLLLDNCDQYPYAEERRLFYVALTRAKKKAFIVTINGQESEFAIELKKRYGNELKKEQFECPLCGGRLVKRSGPYGEFFGCSNYRTTGCNYKRKIR